MDVLAVLGQVLPQKARDSLTEGLLTLSGKPGSGKPERSIELIAVCRSGVLPWRYPPRREYLYGEWLREEMERGQAQGPADDPDLTLILAQAIRHSAPLLGPRLEELLDPVPMRDVRRAMRDCLPGLLKSLRGDERNVLLTLARMWYTAAQGDFIPKDAAAAWAAPRLTGSAAALLETASRAYRGESGDHWAGRESEAGALARELAEGVAESLGRGEE